VGMSIFVFHQETSFAYLLFPLLIWATLRFWQPGATVAVLAVAGLAVYFTAHGHGPYVRDDPDDSLLLAQTFFGIAAVTMMSLGAVITERARAQETVTYIAGALQEGLLPPGLPEIPGIDLAARFRPVGQDYRVGGDFYDVFESRPGRWIVVVGDVSGKGPNAAAVTGLARHTIRTAAIHDDSPSQVLSVLNGALRERLSPREVCTAVYVRLEPVDEGFEVTVSSGGHPLPLLLRGDGTVHEFGAHGLVLGANPELELAESAVTLKPGDSLLLYTDGLTEAYAPAYISVRPDIQSLLEAHTGSSANEIAEDVYRRMLDFSPSEPRDDVALVVLRIGEEAPSKLPDSVARADLESRR
jgi:serine phosphatase RsbU (regulator of sigma subunit)